MLSVVICTCRRAESLRRTLQSLAECQRPEGLAWELVVVDNAPTGEVERLVGKFAPALPVRCVAEPEPGLCNARNRGVAESRGEVVWFIDDDVRVDPGWLRAVCDATAAHPEVAFFAGRILPDWCGASLPPWLDVAAGGLGDFGGMYLHYEPDVKTRLLQATERAYGANMGFRRDVFSKVGGFRSDLGVLPGKRRLGEDTEFCERLVTAGLAGVYVAPALVHHVTPASRLTVRYALAWAFAHGRDVARICAIRRERQGRNTWPRRARDIAKHTVFLIGNLVLAATAGWFLDRRRRVGAWFRLIQRVGMIFGVFGHKPALVADWPACLTAPVSPGCSADCVQDTPEGGR